MIRNIEKTVAINEFHALRNEPSGAKIIALLDILVNELRKENDTVDRNGLQLNQGEIKAYLRLKEYIERGLPKVR